MDRSLVQASDVAFPLLMWGVATPAAMRSEQASNFILNRVWFKVEGEGWTLEEKRKAADFLSLDSRNFSIPVIRAVWCVHPELNSLNKPPHRDSSYSSKKTTHEGFEKAYLLAIYPCSKERWRPIQRGIVPTGKSFVPGEILRHRRNPSSFISGKIIQKIKGVKEGPEQVSKYTYLLYSSIHI